MKKFTQTILSVMLCMVLTVTMCAAYTGNVFADATYTEMAAGSSIPAVDISSGATIENLYLTPTATRYETFNYSVYIPVKGSFFLYYTSQDSSPYASASGGGSSYAGQDTGDNGVMYKAYNIAAPGTVNISLSCSAGCYIGFAVGYAPADKSVPVNSTFILGSGGSNIVSTVTVKVPSKGYLEFEAADGITGRSSGYVKTKGFKDWQSIYSTGKSYIGVKKGTYTIQLKGSVSVYGVRVQFHKVKETSVKTSKSKAAKLTKKKTNKGLIVTNSKKTHWYKIKNPKKQKMVIAANAKKMSYGNNTSISGLKITVYYPDKKSDSVKLYAGTSNEYTVTYDTIGSSKARKGTYYIKVQSFGGGNGYYTIKWK